MSKSKPLWKKATYEGDLEKKDLIWIVFTILFVVFYILMSWERGIECRSNADCLHGGSCVNQMCDCAADYSHEWKCDPNFSQGFTLSEYEILALCVFGPLSIVSLFLVRCVRCKRDKATTGVTTATPADKRRGWLATLFIVITIGFFIAFLWRGTVVDCYADAWICTFLFLAFVLFFILTILTFFLP
jgi:hypothetical protein